MAAKRIAGHRRARAGLVVLLSMGCLAFAPSAGAATFFVDTLQDTGTNTGCASTTDGAACGLREAITQANANGNSPTQDKVEFPEAFLKEGTIFVPEASPGMPTVTEPLKIEACTVAPSEASPCIGLTHQGPPAGTAFTIDSVNVVLRGFAVANWDVGANVPGNGAKLRNNWFGATTGGGPVPNGFGVTISGSGNEIGGFAGATGNEPATRNVFAGSASNHVRIQGGDSNQVRGNHFSINPVFGLSGVTSPLTQIVVTGEAGDDAVGNVIGGTASADHAATNACDGPCNLFTPTSERAIDLQGPVFASKDSVVAGNFIGLLADGNSTCCAGSAEATVGEAEGAVIGGDTKRERNYFAGGGKGVTAASTADGLKVMNNFFGLNSAGNGRVPMNDRAAEIASGTFKGNRVGGPATAFQSSGLLLKPANSQPTRVRGNKFGFGLNGAAMGMNTAITVNGDGNVIGGGKNKDANVIGFQSTSLNGAIFIDGGDDNRVIGNRIGVDTSGTNMTNSGAGVLLRNAASRNEIGGTLGSQANVISNSAGGAIELEGDGVDGNRIVGNRGSGNGGDIFIDLDPLEGAGVAGNGPNAATPAPTVTTVSSTAVSGTALPGATVDVYRTTNTSTSQIDAYLGQVVADGAGAWSLTVSLSPGDRAAATQTPAGTPNTSELTAAVAQT